MDESNETSINFDLKAVKTFSQTGLKANLLENLCLNMSGYNISTNYWIT